MTAVDPTHASVLGPPPVASVVQAGSVLFDTPRTLEKLADLVATVRATRASLAVFPEAFVGGYPKESSLASALAGGQRMDVRSSASIFRVQLMFPVLKRSSSAKSLATIISIS